MSTSPALRPPEPGPWPARLALAAALAAVPLVLFGGSVTTLGAGMAVDGWLIAEGHFLLFFPVESWFRDTPTFVEHTHRLFGVLVGFFALGCALATWRAPAARGARLVSSAALLAVIAQGALGGLRVLENEPRLAFVHGAVAQAVLALLVANALVLSRAWRAASAIAREHDAGLGALRSSAGLALVLVYAQVALGAWYRHGLRPSAVVGVELRFALHGLGALAVLAALAAVVRRGAALRAAGVELAPGFARALRVLPALVLVQLVLGGLAWAGYRPHAIGPAEWGISIAHVLGGGLLLSDVACIWLWTRRLSRGEAAFPADAGRPAWRAS